MSLKDLIRSIHGPSDLISELNMFLLQRPEEDRSGAWHPSGFGGMCARQKLLQRILKIDLPVQEIGPKQKRIFDVGKAIHRWYQEEYFGPMGVLWGRWQCRDCHLIKWGKMPQGKCGRCNGESGYRYLEVPVRAKLPGCEKLVEGSCDGVLDIHSLWFTLEIKSINEGGFRYLSQPKEGAAAQGQIYNELIVQGHVPAPEGIFIPKPSKILCLYVNKNDSTEKEFVVEPDSKFAREKLSEPIKFETGLREKDLPPKWDRCDDKGRIPAKNCPMKKYCFQKRSWIDYERMAV